MYYMGIDLGTSSLKIVICDINSEVIVSREAPLEVIRECINYSEQRPSDWSDAMFELFAYFSKNYGDILSKVEAIGFSGQMHGVVPLDSDGKALCNALLWNDGRAYNECLELEQVVPDLKEITGNIAMAGFSAPKILWLKKYRAELYAKISMILLPKDYLRYLLSGEFVSDMSDTAGTLLLDLKRRDYSDKLLEALSLSRKHFPRLVEGCEGTGFLDVSIAEKYGFKDKVILVAGAGDNAASAISIGAVSSNDTFISLGTSGVIFNVSDRINSAPEKTVHSFCHCLPNLWHTMSVSLSATSALNWILSITDEGSDSLGYRLNEVYKELPISSLNDKDPYELPIFLPYLVGERTPHNNPNACGMLFNLNSNTSKNDMVYAVLEGVANSFRDGFNCLESAGAVIEKSLIVGGGTRSEYWLNLISSCLDLRLEVPFNAEIGGAIGAARLAMIGDGVDINKAVSLNKIKANIYPVKELRSFLDKRYEIYRNLYIQTKSLLRV